MLPIEAFSSFGGWRYRLLWELVLVILVFVPFSLFLEPKRASIDSWKSTAKRSLIGLSICFWLHFCHLSESMDEAGIVFVGLVFMYLANHRPAPCATIVAVNCIITQAFLMWPVPYSNWMIPVVHSTVSVAATALSWWWDINLSYSVVQGFLTTGVIHSYWPLSPIWRLGIASICAAICLLTTFLLIHGTQGHWFLRDSKTPHVGKPAQETEHFRTAMNNACIQELVQLRNDQLRKDDREGLLQEIVRKIDDPSRVDEWLKVVEELVFLSRCHEADSERRLLYAELAENVVTAYDISSKDSSNTWCGGMAVRCLPVVRRCWQQTISDVRKLQHSALCAAAVKHYHCPACKPDMRGVRNATTCAALSAARRFLPFLSRDPTSSVHRHYLHALRHIRWVSSKEMDGWTHSLFHVVMIALVGVGLATLYRVRHTLEDYAVFLTLSSTLSSLAALLLGLLIVRIPEPSGRNKDWHHRNIGLVIPHYGKDESKRDLICNTVRAALRAGLRPRQIVVAHNQDGDAPHEDEGLTLEALDGISQEWLAQKPLAVTAGNKDGARGTSGADNGTRVDVSMVVGGVERWRQTTEVVDGQWEVAVPRGDRVSTGDWHVRYNKNEHIRYTFTSKGDKNTPVLLSTMLSSFEFVLVTDSDTDLPPDFTVPMHEFDTDPNTQAIALTICASHRDAYGDSASACEVAAFQDLEYKMSDFIKMLQAKLGTAIYMHGAAQVWRRQVFVKTILEGHDGHFSFEDMKASIRMLTFNKTARIACGGDYPTRTAPCDHWICYNKPKEGCKDPWLLKYIIPPVRCQPNKCPHPEGSIIFQRVGGWDPGAMRGLHLPIQFVLSTPPWHWSRLPAKIFVLGDLLNILIGIARPALLVMVLQSPERREHFQWGLVGLVISSIILLLVFNYGTLAKRRDLQVPASTCFFYWTYQLRLAMVTPLALLMHVLILLTVPIPPALGTYKTLPRFISSQRFVSLTEENPPTPTDEERRRHAEALWGARVYGLRRSSGQLCPVEYDPDAATWRPAPTAPVDAIPEDLSRVVRWEVPVWVDRVRVALHVAIVSCCFLLVGVSIAIAVHDPQEFLTAFLLWELTWLSVATAFTFALMWLHAWLDSRVRLVDARAPDRRPDQYDNVKVTNPDEYALFTDAERTAPASLLPFSSASSSSAG